MVGFKKIYIYISILINYPDCVQCGVCSVQCAVCSVQCVVCSVQCAVCYHKSYHLFYEG